MPIKIKEKKWILYRHTNNLDIVKAVAVNLKNYTSSGISQNEKSILNQRLRDLNYYAERNPELPLDAINHKINTLAYFMFGYKSTVHGKKKFLFSPLGDLMLRYFDERSKSSKIFLSQLYAIQFPHPHAGTHEEFKLYPYRLLFRLLLDKRLDGRIYSIEVAAILVFVTKVSASSYESLVRRILDFRELNGEQVMDLLRAKSHVHVNAYYEWDYYQSKLFESAGILRRVSGSELGKMKHGRSTTRTIRHSYVELNDDIKSFCEILDKRYSALKPPLELHDSMRLTIDVCKEIYSFLPIELLEGLGEKQSFAYDNVIKLMQAIDYHSENPESKSPYLFEELLTDGFNYFTNVEAISVGGAGQTDIECIFLDEKFKFCVDAKSSSKKLSSLNGGRLRLHRKKIGAGYTIVITPRYVPSVLTDILGERIVVILSSTFTEYLYQLVTDRSKDTDYTELHNLILENEGRDISAMLSDLTFDQFGV